MDSSEVLRLLLRAKLRNQMSFKHWRSGLRNWGSATIIAPLRRAGNAIHFTIFTFGKTMRHVISAVVQNVPGVLAHISGMLASRGYNIDSLAVGETEDSALSRMTFVVVGDDKVVEQVRKQLEKIVTVVHVHDISAQEYVERDLMLVKVAAEIGSKRTEIRELVDIFRGRIVDVGYADVIVEISGQESKVQAFIERIRPFGILELVRTGRIAMVRGIHTPLQELPDSASEVEYVA